MSVDVKTRADLESKVGLFYSARSLRFARDLMWDLEHQLKETALQLAVDAGRNTVSEDDMRNAALGLLKPAIGLLDDPDAVDA